MQSYNCSPLCTGSQHTLKKKEEHVLHILALYLASTYTPTAEIDFKQKRKLSDPSVVKKKKCLSPLKMNGRVCTEILQQQQASSAVSGSWLL